MKIFSELMNNYLPNLIISGNGVDASFNNFTINDYKYIHKISKSLNCYHLCDISDSAGLIAANLCESPFEYADVVTCSPFATLRGPRGAAMIIYRSELSSKIDNAVFPGHQGGPHNHTISAMATSLKMAKTDEFVGYQSRCIQNAKIIEESLKYKYNKKIIKNGTCVGIQAINDDMDNLYDILNQVNINVFYDKMHNQFRISSNAMTTRGLDSNHFSKIIDLFDDTNNLSQKVKQNGLDKCQNDINALKTEIANSQNNSL